MMMLSAGVLLMILLIFKAYDTIYIRDAYHYTRALRHIKPKPNNEMHLDTKPVKISTSVPLSHNNYTNSGSTIEINQYDGDVPDIYWINLDRNHRRRQFMEHQLFDLGLSHNSRRVSAIHPNSSLFKLDKLVKPCKRNTDKDVAVILSHLAAIHAAIYTPITSICSNSSLSHYALILEDDVRWEYHINFTEMVSRFIPQDASILQLLTSNREAILLLWDKYNSTTSNPNPSLYWTLSDWRATSKGGKHALYWSCQAYLIYKPRLKEFIDDVINLHPLTHSIESFKIINSFNPRSCVRKSDYPCVLSNCLFSDTYIYGGGGPTYVSNIPLLNGGRVGYDSNIHQNQVQEHKHAFSLIHRLHQRLTANYYWDRGIYRSTSEANMAQNRSRDTDISPLIWGDDKRLPSFLQPLNGRNMHDTGAHGEHIILFKINSTV